MRILIGLAFVIGAAVWLSVGTPAQRRVLRVCADPNNLPFSNDRGEGFENRIAELLARELQAELEYTWWAQRRGFVRNTLKAGACDVIPGVPAKFEMTDTTAPYYRSTYVFVQRRGSGPRIESMDSPALRKLRIGVHLAGDDYANTPPAHALAKRNIVSNVSGYLLTGDYRRPDPPARLLEAVSSGEIDVAIAWGPLAGYYAKRHPEVELTPVSPATDAGPLSFVYDISMGVRHGDRRWKRELERILERRRLEIQSILDDYGVPREAPVSGPSGDSTL
jgi:quinoprotein dehydrogenase-associated probable ABC transporter substrate-binding protein